GGGERGLHPDLRPPGRAGAPPLQGVHRQPARGGAGELRRPRPQAHPQFPRRALPGRRARPGAAARRAGARAGVARPPGGRARLAGGAAGRPAPAAAARRGGRRARLARSRAHAGRGPAGGGVSTLDHTPEVAAEPPPPRPAPAAAPSVRRERMEPLNLARRPFLNSRPVVRIALLLWVLGFLLLLGNVSLFWGYL